MQDKHVKESFTSVPDGGATSSSDAIDCEHIFDKHVWFEITSGTANVQISPDASGDNWLTVGTRNTAGKHIVYVPERCARVRINGVSLDIVAASGAYLLGLR